LLSAQKLTLNNHLFSIRFGGARILCRENGLRLNEWHSIWFCECHTYIAILFTHDYQFCF